MCGRERVIDVEVGQSRQTSHHRIVALLTSVEAQILSKTTSPSSRSATARPPHRPHNPRRRQSGAQPPRRAGPPRATHIRIAPTFGAAIVRCDDHLRTALGQFLDRRRRPLNPRRSPGHLS